MPSTIGPKQESSTASGLLMQGNELSDLVAQLGRYRVRGQSGDGLGVAGAGVEHARAIERANDSFRHSSVVAPPESFGD